MKITVAHFEVLFQYLAGRGEKTDEKSQEQRFEVGTSEYEAGMVIQYLQYQKLIRLTVMYLFSVA